MITFVYGSQSYFDQMLSEGEIEEGSLYFINDTQRIYRGSELIVQTSVRMIDSIPTPDKIVPNTIYILKTTTEDNIVTRTIMVSEGSTLIPISSQGSGGQTVIDPITLFNMIAKMTSKDVIDGKLADDKEATDNKLITAGAVRQAFGWESI